MIRHLRWKVVATNMLLLSLVLLIMFAAVFFISRGNYRRNVQQQLNQALEQGDYGINQPGMDSIPCFVAEVYGSGTVRVAGNSYYDLSDETKMTEIVTAALRQDSDSGTLDEFHLRYLRRAGYTTTAIAFTDTYLEYTSLRTLLAACSMVGCGALVVLFVCSYLLSGEADRGGVDAAGAVSLRRQPRAENAADGDTVLSRAAGAQRDAGAVRLRGQHTGGGSPHEVAGGGYADAVPGAEKRREAARHHRRRRGGGGDGGVAVRACRL